MHASMNIFYMENQAMTVKNLCIKTKLKTGGSYLEINILKATPIQENIKQLFELQICSDTDSQSAEI